MIRIKIERSALREKDLYILWNTIYEQELPDDFKIYKFIRDINDSYVDSIDKRP